MVGLVEVLQGRQVPSWQRTGAVAMLSFPWCWPPSPELESAARALTGLPHPTELHPGEVCLVSVDGTRASLWHWTRPQKGLHYSELIGDARTAEALAWRLACRHAPVIARPHVFGSRGTHRAQKFASSGDPRDAALNGNSFGLALGLSVVSLLLGVPCPANAVALAALNEDGATVEVGGLEHKLRVLYEYALGVTRFLVHPDQAAAARRALAGNGDVIPVSSLQEAISTLWPDAVKLVRGRWESDLDQAAKAADLFYRRALENSRLVTDWTAIASSASLLHELLSEDAKAARKARFAMEVARRHLGPVAAPLTWAVVDGPHSDWLNILAHDVQSWSDAGATADDCIAAAEGAWRQVAPPERRSDADWKLLGAIGRAFAAANQPARAIAVLREATEGWRERDRPDDASYPLCELIRVLGLHGSRPELQTALDEYVTWVRSPESRLGEISATFIAFAVGRAWITIGDPARGLYELSADVAPWSHALPHVQHARQRWLARGHAARGDLAAARQHRCDLEQTRSVRDPDANVDLARLDAALETDADPSPIVAELLVGSEANEFKRVRGELHHQLGREASSNELARYFSDHYRY